MERISWTDHIVRSEEVLQGVKEERNIVHTKNKGRLSGMVTSCIITAL
jgi:hypothetical protein